jgi:hypothetical protein
VSAPPLPNQPTAIHFEQPENPAKEITVSSKTIAEKQAKLAASTSKEETTVKKTTKQTPRGANHNGIDAKKAGPVKVKKVAKVKAAKAAAKVKKERTPRQESPYRIAVRAALESGKVTTFSFADEATKKVEAYKAWTARRALAASKTVGVSMAPEGKVVIGPYAVVNAATEKKATKKATKKAAPKAEKKAAPKAKKASAKKDAPKMKRAA